MLPDILLLLALLLGFHGFEAADGRTAPDLLQGLGGTAAATLVAIALSRILADRTARRVEEDGAEAGIPGSRAPMLHPLLAWIVSIFAFRWDELVAANIPKTWFILPYVVFLLPLALTSAAAWIAVDRNEAVIAGRKVSARRALRGGLRRNALVLVPVGVVLLVHRGFVALDAAGLRAAGRILSAFHAYPDLVYGALGVGVLAFLLLAPTILRRALGAGTLPPGETRDAVNALLDRLRVRRRDALLWPTEGRVKNALTMGATGRTRYVVLSDGLIATFPTPELLAVVAHEAGHVRRHHFLLHTVALVSLLLVFVGTSTLLAPFLPGSGETTFAILVLWFGWFAIVRRLSRRFETESDVFAAEHAADGDPAADLEVRTDGMSPGAIRTMLALKRVERVGDGGIRHGPSRVRMAYVAAWATTEASRVRHRAGERRLRLGIAAFAVLACVVTALRMPATLARGDALMAFDDAVEISKQGDVARRAKDLPTTTARDRRSFVGFQGVVRAADEHARDPDMRRLAALAEYNAADRAIRGLGQAETARIGFEKTLSRLELLDDAALSPLRHAALVDLGRLALARKDDPAAGLVEAKRRLAAAVALPVASPSDRYVRARTRLLEAAVALRSADSAESDQARRDLEVQARGTDDGEPEWLELADDAAAELARVPKR